MQYQLPENLKYESSARMSLTKPVNSDGTPTNYYKLLLTMALLGKAKKVDILEAAGYDLHPVRTHWFTKKQFVDDIQVGGFLSSVFTLFTKAGLAEYNPKTRTWSVNPENFGAYISRYAKGAI